MSPHGPRCVHDVQDTPHGMVRNPQLGDQIYNEYVCRHGGHGFPTVTFRFLERWGDHKQDNISPS